jgi:hypothetical protein
MATSSLVQYLSAADDKVAASNRRVTETFYAGADITAGQCVCFDTSQTGADRVVFVVPADTAAPATQQAIGVCLDTIDVSAVDDLRVTVVVKGYVEGATVSTSTVEGSVLTSGATAGEAALYDADAVDANYLPFAQALEADTAGAADIWVFGTFS